MREGESVQLDKRNIIRETVGKGVAFPNVQVSWTVPLMLFIDSALYNTGIGVGKNQAGSQIDILAHKSQVLFW